MQRPEAADLPSLDALASTPVQAIHGLQDLTEEEFYLLDWPQTWRHDDAISIREADGGYHVHTAVTDVGAPGTIYYDALPDTLSMWPYRKKLAQHHRLRHKTSTPVILVSYWTNGGGIEQPEISRGLITPRATQKHRLPSDVKDQLLQGTRAHNLSTAIEHLMITHNRVVGDWLYQSGLPAPFHNHHRQRRFYSLEPLGHDHLRIKRYANATSPLRSDVHRITVQQLHEALANGEIATEKHMRAFCEFYNNRISDAA